MRNRKQGGKLSSAQLTSAQLSSAQLSSAQLSSAQLVGDVRVRARTSRDAADGDEEEVVEVVGAAQAEAADLSGRRARTVGEQPHMFFYTRARTREQPHSKSRSRVGRALRCTMWYRWTALTMVSGIGLAAPNCVHEGHQAGQPAGKISTG